VTKRNTAGALVGVAAGEPAMAAASRIAGDDGIPVINHPVTRGPPAVPGWLIAWMPWAQAGR
jgi:hypothetical protein